MSLSFAFKSFVHSLLVLFFTQPVHLPLYMPACLLPSPRAFSVLLVMATLLPWIGAKRFFERSMLLTLPRKAFRSCDLEPGMEPWGLFGGLSYGTRTLLAPDTCGKGKEKGAPSSCKSFKTRAEESALLVKMDKLWSCWRVGVSTAAAHCANDGPSALDIFCELWASEGCFLLAAVCTPHPTPTIHSQCKQYHLRRPPHLFSPCSVSFFTQNTKNRSSLSSLSASHHDKTLPPTSPRPRPPPCLPLRPPCLCPAVLLLVGPHAIEPLHFSENEAARH